MNKTIHITYFAVLREQAGKGSETIETNASTALDLYNELKNKYKFHLSTNLLKVAVNQEFADWKTSIKTNDTIVFIPPVAGG